MSLRWTFCLTILAAALAGTAGPSSAAPIFSTAELTFDAISPNNDGIQELTEIRYTVAVDSADVRISLLDGDGGSLIEILQVFTRQGGTHSRAFDGVVGTGPLPDGEYRIQILGIGAGGEGQETVTLDLTIDRIPPEITSLSLVSPSLPVFTNGMRVTLQACVSGDPESVVAEFSALDSEYSPTAVTATQVGATCTRFSYTISSANTLPDRDDLPIPVTARDRAGNAVQEDFFACLSNSPPVILSTKLLNQYAVLQNGDQILVEVDVDATNPVTVGADFSDLDSSFDPEDVQVTPLGGNAFRLAYTLSEGNNRPDGEYALHILAYDVVGCGIDEDTNLDVVLDNRGALPALITDVSLNVAAISPADEDGVNDSVTITFRVIEDTVRVIGSVDYVRLGETRVRNLRLFSEDFAEGIHQFTWNGLFPLPFEEIPDQVLTVNLRAVSVAQDRQRDVHLPLELDHTPPQFLSFRPPVPDRVKNGQRVDFSVVMDRPNYTLHVDFSALDSEAAGRSVAVADSGNGAYGISYVVSEFNSIPDGTDKIIPITATDLAGNTATDEGFVRLCLSNQPPRHVSTVLRENQGPFSTGDQIVLRTTWTDGRWSTSQPPTVTADFGKVDSEFSDRKDKMNVVPVTVTTATAVYDIAYTISSGNDFNQGTPFIGIIVSDNPDLGCGSTTVSDAISVQYDAVDPDRPEFDPVSAVTRVPVITLSGIAEGADLVQILLNDAVIDTFTVDGLSHFSGEVTLAPGENRFTGIGIDLAGNTSRTSFPVEVFFVEGNVFDVPGRFSPGSEFFVALQGQASLVTVRVFNLDGVEIARVSDGPGDLFRIPWDGTDDTGHLASSGPYIAVVDIDNADGGRQRLKKAFFFSRRGA